ncbi:hypothetical protein ACFSTD_01825 [Novosphingobium colocasiae]|uniref:hypothetical protein n=1 Tax=Novosphingobium colocasiae TaxID=1256513 RepID=UPI00167252A1|nr:hypothetical protein [Novosphingobium colocasiae]
MSWTAIVPIKAPEARKTRLVQLDASSRLALSETFLKHVLAAVDGHPAIRETVLLCAAPHEGYGWIEDRQRGLNAELTSARQGRGAVLVVHADLPSLTGEDVSALLVTAERYGGALAPDRHGSGTNAVA